MILHIELNNVMILLILLPNKAIVFFIIFIMACKEEMDHFMAINTMNVAPSFTCSNTFYELTWTHRASNHNINIIITSMRIIHNGMIGVRILHCHILNEVLLWRINSIFAIVQEALLLGSMEKTLINRFCLIEKILSDDISSFVNRQLCEFGTIHEFLCIYPLITK